MLHAPSLARWLAAAALAVGVVLPASALVPFGLENAICLECHESTREKIKVAGEDGEKRVLQHLDINRIAQGIHAKMDCVTCHTNIVDAKENHSKAPNVPDPDCLTCHRKLWDEVKAFPQGKERLGTVYKNIQLWEASFHARPDTDNPERVKAYCRECHATHDFAVPKQGVTARKHWSLTVPETCGPTCHEEQYEEWSHSVHGKLILEEADTKSAVCSDCHTSHAVVGGSSDAHKLRVVEACGSCHKEQLASYRKTYHGQVNKLGYTYTAKCFDCHNNHEILKKDDPEARTHVDNRLKACEKCHSGKKEGIPKAAEGWLTFHPHANTNNFAKFPGMWIADKVMKGLLIFVFAFFGLHSALWFFRELKDRRDGKAEPMVNLEGLQLNAYFRRFTPAWRALHAVAVLAVITLILTGSTVLYAGSPLAPVIAELVGGPRVLGLIHRTAAAVLLTLFVIHAVTLLVKVKRDKTFSWSGPDSLLPNRKDFADCAAMFRWFLGKGERPRFDRWTYYEKFDYWAMVIGIIAAATTGLIMAFPTFIATYLPGSIFNVSLLIHGHEAVLAAVFLFTVHVFNTRFRPNRTDTDGTMSSGLVSLDDFRRNHPAHYQRLIASGELANHLAPPPTNVSKLKARMVNFVLLTLALIILAIIGTGVFTA
ncbi:MAG: cytochrome C [Betaproteobacteria bacterium]|nr:cytochrome C [Betaproteobacteria bacterium]